MQLRCFGSRICLLVSTRGWKHRCCACAVRVCVCVHVRVNVVALVLLVVVGRHARSYRRLVRGERREDAQR